MAALKEIAREYAAEIRDGIGWVIVYRTGRSWHALTVWSDLGNNEWETDDINDALEALRLDPRAVVLNGYYLGHFGDMTIDDFLLCRAPPKWRHYALHAKRARVRKKYRNRIRRAFFAALASEGGGSS